MKIFILSKKFWTLINQLKNSLRKKSRQYFNINLLSSWIKDDHQLTSSKDSVNMNMPTHSDIESNPLNDKTMIRTDLKMNISSREIAPLSTSILTPPTSNYFFSEDQLNCDNDNLQIQSEVLEEESFQNVLDVPTSDITLIDSILNEDLFQSNISTNEFYQNLPNNSDIDNDFLFSDEIIDLLPLDIDNLLSTYQEQTNQNINTAGSSNTHITTVNNQSYVNKEGILNETIKNPKTLFVSGLGSCVNKSDLYNHFNGCTKVTIKQYNTTSPLKYAFVVHRTPQEAKHNLERPIDFSIFGSKCFVQYACNSSALSKNYRNFGNKKLAIHKIPENVTENDLQRLFINSHIIKYSPAHPAYSSDTTTKMKDKNKILSGYAFILYDNEQQAVNVIKHADQYRINGQQLVISVYRNKNHHMQR